MIVNSFYQINFRSIFKSITSDSILPIFRNDANDHVALRDLGNYFMQNRIIFISGEIEQDMANGVIGQFLYLESKSHDPITVYLSSYGGEIAAGLAICDVIQFISSQVNIICTSVAMSMGAVILACGDKRYALPNARIMIHQPMITLSRSQSFKQSEMQITALELKYLRSTLVSILSEKTGQSIYKIENDLQEDRFMNAKEALDYGLLDEIILSKKTNISVKKSIGNDIEVKNI